MDFNIYAIANYIYADGFALSYRVEGFKDCQDVKMHVHKHFADYREYVIVVFPETTPTFELLDCVTQL